MTSFQQDLRHGVRMWARDPRFTVVAVLTLALGVGASTTIASAVNGILLRPFPYEEQERLAILWERNLGLGFPFMFVAPPNYADWARASESFESMAAFTTVDFTLEGDPPEQVPGGRVSASLFPTLGVAPLHGRFFLPEEDAPGAPPVVLLSHGFWQRRLGGRAGILGETIVLDAEPHIIVGVMPKELSFPPPIALEGNLPERDTELWVPLGLDYASGQRGAHYLTVVGRLSEGKSLGDAQVELDRVAAGLATAYPASNEGWDIHVVDLTEQVTGDLRRPLLVLTGAVTLVLLIACANVASLLLGRGLERSREMAIRASLGAGRRRLLRQVLTENLLLAAVAGGAGLIVAAGGVEALVAFGPKNLPRLSEVGLDGGAALASAFVCLGAGLLFGLAPAVRLGALGGFDRLKDRQTGTSRRTSSMRKALVVVEVALALTLLVGAGLLLRSFRNLRAVDPGFSTEGAFLLSTSLPASRYAEASSRARLVETVLEELSALPGVEAAGAVNELPLAHDRQGTSFQVAGEPAPPAGQEPQTAVALVSPDYFESLGVPLLRGRHFDERDREAAPPVVVVNETFARRYFPDRDPLGVRLHLG